MTTRIVLGITSAIFLIAAIVFGSQLIVTAKAYQKEKEAYTTSQNYQNRLLDFDQWLPNGDHSATTAEGKAAKSKIEALQIKADRFSTYLLGCLLAYGLFLIGWQRKAASLPLAMGGGLLIALVCLGVGLFSPILEIAAYEKDLSIPVKVKTDFLSLNIDYTANFAGEMYFYYQSKSIVELIGLLFEQRNFIVGGSILVFSLLFPLGKTLFTLFALLSPRLMNNPLFSFFIFKTSKWSMADVFVAAIFLSFLAFSNMQTGIRTDSNVLWGLYYFLAYCLLSITSAVILQKNWHPISH
ncbi:MAG: paraquat-inducible protein A [Saprospiraceae bacterium]